MSRFLVDSVSSLKPYVPGEQPLAQAALKLNTNEHALPPSTAVMAAISAVTGEQLRRYPDPTARLLSAAIAQQEGLSIEQVFVGNGSDEVLAHLWAVFLAHRPVTTLDITYGFYPVWSQLYGSTLTQSPLRDDFSVDIGSLMNTQGALVLANPNAPTGLSITRSQIESLVTADRNRLIVIDEAYYGFGAETAAPLTRHYDNLIVTRSLSKSHSLAGLRVGYALAHSELIDGLNRIKDSFNSYPLDSVAQAAATAAIQDKEWVSRASEVIINSRQSMSEGLIELGFEVLPSQTNFIFTRPGTGSGLALFNALRQGNILVRRWDNPRIAEWLRISIGTPEQTELLLMAVSEILGRAG
ncbi:MAG: histidinol-phosphate transaminase [Luminiphilus sp.]|nr:histidinol-phosphate transaminase [Luminiphilus sp.]